IAENNNYLSHSPSAHTRFHARSIPSIALSPYLYRILKYCPCTNECFLAVLVYFDRMAKHSLATNGQPFSIDSHNIHRLIITGVMIATKFFSDIFYTNARYAKVGGIDLSELNRLEVEFLTLNSFNMMVSVSELQRYGDSLL
ncbi:cyclin, partial [Phycomyces blakesleeanus NRRL 1555(-)]